MQGQGQAGSHRVIVGEGVESLRLPPVPAGEVSGLPDGDGRLLPHLAHLDAQFTGAQAVQEVPELEALTCKGKVEEMVIFLTPVGIASVHNKHKNKCPLSAAPVKGKE